MGPSLFGANFGSRMFLLRFLASSQTLLSTSKGVNLDLIQFLVLVCVQQVLLSVKCQDF